MSQLLCVFVPYPQIRPDSPHILAAVPDAQQMPQGQPLDGVHVLNPGRQGGLLEGEGPSLPLPTIGPSATAREQTGMPALFTIVCAVTWVGWAHSRCSVNVCGGGGE